MIVGLIAFNFHYDVPALLAHWLRRYATEFDEVYLVLLAHSAAVDATSVATLTREYPNVKVYKNQVAHTTPAEGDLARFTIFMEIAKSDGMSKNWLCPADIDEFTQWPSSIRAFLKQADLAGCNVVMGKLCDRVTPNGEPVAITDVDPLTVFTCEWLLTEYERRQTWKTLAVKEGVLFTPGNHHPIVGTEMTDAIKISTLHRPRIGCAGIRIFNETSPLRIEHISWHARRIEQLSTSGLDYQQKAAELHKKTNPPLRITPAPVSGHCHPTEPLRNHYFDEGLCAALVQLLRLNNLKECLDIGCGDGSYTKFLRLNGINCVGVDSARDTVERTHGVGYQANLCDTLPAVLGKEMVLCLEVGEHIEKKYEDAVLRNLARLTKKILVLSWAVPGQAVEGHVNCQTNAYIKGRLQSVGFSCSDQTEESLRRVAKLPWLKNTLMVFRK